MNNTNKLYLYRESYGSRWEDKKLEHIVGIYEGETQNDRPHGYGKLKIINKGEHIGLWKNGKRNGEGLYQELYNSCPAKIAEGSSITIKSAFLERAFAISTIC